jgi:uncharacterized protein HemY
LLKADYLILHNDYPAAEKEVTAVLKTAPNNTRGVTVKATLQIQAWRAAAGYHHLQKYSKS